MRRHHCTACRASADKCLKQARQLEGGARRHPTCPPLLLTSSPRRSRSALGWAGLGWAGLGWAGLGWAGLGWAQLGWAGLGWAGLGWAGLGWAGLGWAGLLGWAAGRFRPRVRFWGSGKGAGVRWQSPPQSHQGTAYTLHPKALSPRSRSSPR